MSASCNTYEKVVDCNNLWRALLARSSLLIIGTTIISCCVVESNESQIKRPRTGLKVDRYESILLFVEESRGVAAIPVTLS
jgi:hypothetical protein